MADSLLGNPPEAFNGLAQEVSYAVVHRLKRLLLVIGGLLRETALLRPYQHHLRVNLFTLRC
ncbi:MAG: hypothetical protein Q8N96_03130 [Methylovulum sp.]|nr:hypothetical protein [Methylovulum sp.]